jgi:hypothetical protein
MSFYQISCSNKDQFELQETDNLTLGSINHLEFLNDKIYILDLKNNNFVIYNTEGEIIDSFIPTIALSDSFVRYNRNNYIDQELVYMKDMEGINIKEWEPMMRPLLGDFSIKNDSLVYISIQVMYPIINLKVQKLKSYGVSPGVFVIEYNTNSKKIRYISMEGKKGAIFQKFSICSHKNNIFATCITSIVGHSAKDGPRSLIGQFNENGDKLSTAYYFPKEIDNEIIAYPTNMIMKSFKNNLWFVFGYYPRMFCLDSLKEFDLVIKNSNKIFFKRLSNKTGNYDSLKNFAKKNMFAFYSDTNNMNIRISNFWERNDTLYIAITKYISGGRVLENITQCYTFDGKYIREFKNENFEYITGYQNKIARFYFDSESEKFFVKYKDY